MSRKYRYWTPEDDAILVENAGKKTPTEIGLLVGRSKNSIMVRAGVLNVSLATIREKHKGNSQVKQSELKRAVELFKEMGRTRAVAEAMDIKLSRAQYLLSLARRYELLPKTGNAPHNLSPLQKKVLEWVRKNPGKTTRDCISFFRKADVSYYSAENAHIRLRRLGLIVREGDMWTSVK